MLQKIQSKRGRLREMCTRSVILERSVGAHYVMSEKTERTQFTRYGPVCAS